MSFNKEKIKKAFKALYRNGVLSVQKSKTETVLHRMQNERPIGWSVGANTKFWLGSVWTTVQDVADSEKQGYLPVRYVGGGHGPTSNRSTTYEIGERLEQELKRNGIPVEGHYSDEISNYVLVPSSVSIESRHESLRKGVSV